MRLRFFAVAILAVMLSAAALRASAITFGFVDTTNALGNGGRVPAIALAVDGREDDGNGALGAGYQLHLTKPCDPRALARAIAAITGNTGAHPS
jgi:CheY-like chemotaxis protein